MLFDFCGLMQIHFYLYCLKLKPFLSMGLLSPIGSQRTAPMCLIINMVPFGWKVPKPHVLVSKLFTRFMIYRTISGPYAISWLECKQTNMFDAKSVILYCTSSIVVTKFTAQQFLCEIHVAPLMGTITTTRKAAYATGTTCELWEGHRLGEHTCPLANATGHA